MVPSENWGRGCGSFEREVIGGRPPRPLVVLMLGGEFETLSFSVAMELGDKESSE